MLREIGISRACDQLEANGLGGPIGNASPAKLYSRVMRVAHEPGSEGSPRAGVPVLYEDDVVRAVMRHLELEGWSIDSFALSHEHGDDIVATRRGRRLVVEAKGDGSSKSNTARFGKPFTRNQVKTHVAVAVLRAMRVVSVEEAQAAVALPDSDFHRVEIDRIAPALLKLGVQVFWVASDRSVTVLT